MCRSCGEIWDVECPIGRALCPERCWLTATSRSRVADAITRFAGFMPFVYVHMIWFTAWIALGIERYP